MSGPAQSAPIRDPATSPTRSQRLLRQATYASAATATVLIAAKLVAWFMTDSVAILSSLVDSILDLAASLVTLFAVHQAMVPPDSEHRFGHGKAEPLAAIAQTGFIAGSAVLLMIEAVGRLIDPQPIAATEVGLAVMAISIVATIALVAFQRHVIARAGSIAIQADSAHYRADLAANLGVVAALAVSGYFSLPHVDAAFGILIALYIAYSAWEIGSESLQMLMDRELPDEDREKIKAIALSYPDVEGVHDLRTRRAGRDTFIQMHLDFNGQLSLNRVHATADAVEVEIMEVFSDAEVLIHEDPVTPKAQSGTPQDMEPGKTDE